MRVVTNAAFIQRNRNIAQISFFASILVLAASFFFSWQYGNSENAFFFNCLVVPALFGGMLFAVRMSNRWVREPVAWNAIPEGLKGISTDSVLYQYVLPADHVLVSPYGIFTLYPLFHERPIVVEDGKWMLPGGPVGAMLAFMRQENLGDPGARAQAEAEAVERALNDLFEDESFTVQPIVVFTAAETRVDIRDEELEIPVGFAFSNQNPSLSTLIKSFADDDLPTLSPEQIEQLDEEYIYE